MSFPLYRTLVMGALLGLSGLCQAAVDMQELIDQAVAKGQKQLVLPPGVHRVKPSGAWRDYHLAVRGAKDLEIQGTGATLVFENPAMGGIFFDRCAGVTVRGLTVDWDPLPYTQGRIVAIDPAGPWYEIEVEKGYTDDAALFGRDGTSFAAGAFLYDAKTRLLKRGAWDMFGAKVTRERAGVLRVWFKSANQVKGNIAEVGDLLVVSMRSRIGIRLMNCQAMVIDKVTMWTAPGIALQEAGGEGGSRYTYTVTRGPAPEGGAPRLLSSTADAFNSSSVRVGPIVENCVFEYQGDDGVAIKGTYGLVTGKNEGESLRFSPRREMDYRVGDRLRLYDGQTYQLKGEAKILALTPAKTPGEPEMAQIKALWERYRQDSGERKHFDVKLDHAMETEIGDLISSPDWAGSGFVVRNNVMQHHRAQGIRLKASDGVIENNRIEDVTVTGIAIGPEFSYWIESDYVRNVVVRNNTLRNVGIGGNCMRNGKSFLVGAITVHASTPDGKLPETTGNQNITIEGNRIEDCGGIGMVITCAQDMTIKGNQIGATRILGTMDGGKSRGIDPAAAIFVAQAQRIHFEQNQLSDKPIVSGPGTAEISQ